MQHLRLTTNQKAVESRYLPSRFEFLLRGWRWAGLGALFGLVTAFLFFKLFAPLTVTVTLANRCTAGLSKAFDLPETMARRPPPEPDCALTLPEFPALLTALTSSPLPRTAITGLTPSPSPPPPFSSPRWWEQHLIPVYGVSSAETKKFPLMDEGLKAESTRIQSLQLTTSALGPEPAEVEANQALQWLKEKATLADLRQLLAHYASENQLTESRLPQEALKIERESALLKERIDYLSHLLSSEKKNTLKDPTEVNVGTVAAEFLPLRTQLNAAEVALTDQREHLQKLEDQAAESKVMRTFLEGARDILDSTGPEPMPSSLIRDHMLAHLDQIALTIPASAVTGTLAVEHIRKDILRTFNRFSLLLPEISRRRTRPTLSVESALTALILGSLAGYAGFWLRRAWDRRKTQPSP